MENERYSIAREMNTRDMQRKILKTKNEQLPVCVSGSARIRALGDLLDSDPHGIKTTKICPKMLTTLIKFFTSMFTVFIYFQNKSNKS